MGRLIALLLLLAWPAAADEAGWRALAQQGTAALMRHALAPGTWDPKGFRLDECATQRNLDAEGRAQARAVGAAMRRNGVALDRVLTSEWCRCKETADLLAVGPVEPFPALNSFRGGGDPGQQTAAVRALLSERAGREKLVLVTHQVVITALTGLPVGSGEIIVVAPRPDGTLEVKGRIPP